MNNQLNESHTSYEVNPTAQAANRMLSLLLERAPSDRGIPLSPKQLDIPLPSSLPKMETKVEGKITHLDAVPQPATSQAEVKQVIFEEAKTELDPHRSWKVFIVAPNDGERRVSYLWRSEQDPSVISYGISENAGIDYDPALETAELQKTLELIK